MVSLECAIWELTNLLQFITSVYCARWMSQVQGFGFPKVLTKKRRLLSILFRNLRFTRTNGRYRFFENDKAKEQTRFALLSQAVIDEDIGLDVQELTESIENMNAKSLNYWLCKFVQEVAIKSGGRYPSRTLHNIVCILKRFLVEKNDEGALNPLAVSDKRYR